jgi:hypothetical protein
MTFKLAKVALLLVSMMFFAVLALNIAIPALILGPLALLNWLVLSSDEGRPYPEKLP